MDTTAGEMNPLSRQKPSPEIAPCAPAEARQCYFLLFFFSGEVWAHTNGGVQQRTLLRRVLRRVPETAFEKVLRKVLRRCLAEGFIRGRRVLRRVLRRGSKKGLSRRHLEGRSTPFREYDPVGVCPKSLWEPWREI